MIIKLIASLHLHPEDVEIEEPVFKNMTNGKIDLPFVDWTFMSNFISPFILESLRNCLCWFFIGDAPGTGTGWHYDPIGTSAWLYLMSGTKQWEVDVDVDMIKEEDMKFLTDDLQKIISDKQNDVSSAKRRKISTEKTDTSDKSTGTKENSLLKFRAVQKPGEILYVPSQSHHRVRNILSEVAQKDKDLRDLGEVVVAVTHNYLDKSNFKYFLRDIKTGLRTIVKEKYTEDQAFESESIGPLVFAGIVGMMKHLKVIIGNAKLDVRPDNGENDIRHYEHGREVLDLLLTVSTLHGWDIDDT